MIINGVEIKKYRARVRNYEPKLTSVPHNIANMYSDDYRVVEGYISISAVVLSRDDYTAEPKYVLVFVEECPDFHRMLTAGFGQSVFYPKTYGAGEFEIIGECENVTD